MSDSSGGDRLKTALISGVGGSLLTALMHSTRRETISGHEVEEQFIRRHRPAVYVLWHGRLLTCAFHYRKWALGTLITRNRDGDYITREIERWGYTVVRGSSSRGGSTALKAIVKMLKEGQPVAVTPDGPRGPRQQMKLGPLQAAQLAGVPVIPVAASARSAWWFGSWDRFLVPRPFTWTPVAMGEPIEVGRRLAPAELASLADEVGARLNALTELVDEAARGRRQ